MIVHTAEFLKSTEKIADCPRPELPEFAFIGRSNVGKSSLINLLAGRKSLARVSSTPGKTQTLNFFLLNHEMYWVDLPGYGWARITRKRRNEWKSMIGEYLAGRRNLSCLFVLIDVRLTPQSLDLDFIHDAGRQGIPMALVFTKSDKVNKRRLKENIESFLKALDTHWEERPEYFISSATLGSGRAEILRFMSSILKNVE